MKNFLTGSHTVKVGLNEDLVIAGNFEKGIILNQLGLLTFLLQLLLQAGVSQVSLISSGSSVNNVKFVRFPPFLKHEVF